jgi:glycine/D-amino acid oxidase-like deaminating enzyme
MEGDPRSHGLWESTAPPSPATPMLEDDVRADVVILGGGYMGLSAALHLAEAGADVVVLEAVEVGFGGAGRNVGLVNAGLWVMPDDVEAALGPIHGPRLLETLGAAPALVFDLIDRHGIDCEAVRNGTLHCAVGAAGLRDLRERERQWSERGAPVRVLDPKETAAAVGSNAYAGALLDRRAGTVQPLAYVRGLAGAALKAGATVFTRSAAIDAREQPGSPASWRVGAAQGSVTAEWVIVATDAYAVGPWRSVRSEQVHLPYFNLATRPLPPKVLETILPGRQGAWDTREVLSSFRLDRSGRLVFGSVGALRGTGAAIHPAWSGRALRRLFPWIGAIEFEAEWFGQIGMTADSMPRFHRLGRNVIAFSGMNGRGIAPGTTLGQIAAGFVQGRLDEAALPLPASPTVEPRFRALRELAYEAGSQIAHLAP